jgi:hypothetical protein
VAIAAASLSSQTPLRGSVKDSLLKFYAMRAAQIPAQPGRTMLSVEPAAASFQATGVLQEMTLGRLASMYEEGLFNDDEYARIKGSLVSQRSLVDAADLAPSQRSFHSLVDAADLAP